LTVWRYLLSTSDPALRAVVVEDSVALVGLGIAAAGLALSQLTGSETLDAAAALLIGILLAATAFGLGRLLADFLVGRTLPQPLLQRLGNILASSPAIEEVLLVRAVYVGPEEVIVTAKLRPAPNLTVDQLAHAMDQLDAAMRTTVPLVADVYLDITAYSMDTLPLDADHGYDYQW
jgi:divalent metal cation (Fe/Co/Zn/Cd) transporter